MSWLKHILGEYKNDSIIDSKAKIVIKCDTEVVSGQYIRNSSHKQKNSGTQTKHKSTNSDISPYLADPDSYR